MYLQKVISRKNCVKKISFLLASWRSVTKIAGSGSISQRHGSADPDPHQHVKDPQHWSWCSILQTGCGAHLSSAWAWADHLLWVQPTPPPARWISVKLIVLFRQNCLRNYKKTSGFWPRVRARALRAPVFLSSLAPETGRCAPPPPTQLRCFLFDT